jgi:mannose-1-phosphate guanylyltransferase
MTYTAPRPLRCGIVLAGGDGKRLQPFIRRLLGYDLPKQYVNFIGSRSMLEHTYSRAERIIPCERIFTVVAREHYEHQEVQRQLGNRQPHTLVVQPSNKETGPGLLLPLMHLWKWHPNSIVAVFPSDHFILQEELFSAYVNRAFETVEGCPAKIVFMGVRATDPDPEYGYIIAQNQEPHLSSPSRRIGLFIEKPERPIAEQLVSQGALWNTMVMVFRPEILLHLVSLSAPKLYRSFQQIFRVLGTCQEQMETEKVYEQMEKVNFSRDLLEGFEVHSRNQLSVVAMDEVFWSDWGNANRIASVLEHFHCLDRLRGSIVPENAGSIPFSKSGFGVPSSSYYSLQDANTQTIQ